MNLYYVIITLLKESNLIEVRHFHEALIIVTASRSVMSMSRLGAKLHRSFVERN